MTVQLPPRCSTIDGLEVTEGLTWASWRPGGEYTKKLTVKNVAFDKKKIDFTIPHSQIFGTLVYPKAVTLNPGTSYSVPVVFKPLESKLYEDKIEFKTKNRKIEIPIKAVLPEADIEVPTQLKFGYCGVKDVISIKFHVRNLSSLKIPFQWKVPKCFTISPEEGTLKPDAALETEIKFCPEIAAVYDGQAVLHFNKEKWKSVRLEGIGKYPHVSLQSVHTAKEGELDHTCDFMLPDKILNFGSVDIGSMISRSVDVYNNSDINASFTVSQMNSGRDIDKFFYCTTPSGIIAAQSKATVRFSYQPAVSGHEHIEYFAIAPAGQLSRTVVKCMGKGNGPNVKSSCDHLDFGLIGKVGCSKTLSFTLSNSSTMAAHFQFVTGNFECDSVFRIEPQSGVVVKGHPIIVGVTFKPTHSIGYHRRLQLLLNHQDSIFVDLFGVAHCEQFKPKIITHTHVMRHYQQIKNGLGKLSPEHLEELLAARQITASKSGSLDWSNREEGSVPIQSEVSTFEPLFAKEVPENEKFVTLEKSKFDFGRVTTFNEPLQQTLNITNNTKAKVTIAWTPDQSSKSSFWVEPRVCDIPPLKAQSFRVFFKPDGFDKFFGTQLEAFAFFKVMRDNELVKDERCVTLPRCVVIETVGHTFKSIKDTFKADMDVSSRNLIMPPCVVSTPCYQTLYMKNKGDTSLIFNFDNDPSGHFQFWPNFGMMLPNSVHVCLVRFQGDKTEKYAAKVQCHVNHNAKYLKTFAVSAFIDSPQLLMDTNSMVFMKPTLPGDKVKKKYAVRNNSRLPLNFEWRLSKEDKKYLQIEPSSGVMRPNEMQAHQISLTTQPDTVSHYKTLIKVTSPLTNVHKSYKVQIVCESTEGSLQCVEEVVDFGEVICGNKQTKSFTLFNSSNVDVCFKLDYSLNLNESDDESVCESDEMAFDKPALQLHPSYGSLPARTQKTIQVTINASRRINYEFAIKGVLLNQTPNEKAASNELHLCTVIARGMFPCLQVKDAQCFGAAENMSKIYLCSALNIDRLNEVLDADPEETELRYSAVSRMSMESRGAGAAAKGSFDLANNTSGTAINMNFGAAPTGSPNTKIVLLFENTSHVETEWNFYFPNDLKLELEYWAQSGDFTDEELHQLMVAENKLYRIYPQSGKLQPGQNVAITFTYQHLFPGTNRIPVLLKLNRGREVVINLVGVTIEPQRRYLHFASPVHQFRPVAIGGSDPPQQLYEFYNGGAVPLKCSLDLTALEKCKEENFNCAIFECLDKELYIEPGKTCPLRWIFRPIEAKLYSVEVPVIIEDGETAIVYFEGMGYDKREIGEKGVESAEDRTDTIPTRQMVPKPGQEVFLSEERIAFGDLPLFTRARRIVCLTNTSYNDTVNFEWQPSDDPYSCGVEISPRKGVLGPSESTMFKITFTSTGFPSFYNLDFTCQIVNSSQMSRYEQDLSQWEQLRAEQEQEFTITEKNVNEISRAGSENPLKTPVRLKSKTSKSQTHTPPLTPSEFDFKHYETLPPIKKTRGDKDHRKSNRKSREVVTEDGWPIWERPIAPKPFLMHLGVTARSHNIQEFEDSFGNVSTFLIDRTLSADFETDIEKLKHNPERISCLCAEYDLASGVFTSLLKSMFEDSSFHQAIRNVQKEPVPYFTQLRLTEPKMTTSQSKGAEDDGDVVTADGDLDAKATQQNFQKEATDLSSVFKEHEEGQSRRFSRATSGNQSGRSAGAVGSVVGSAAKKRVSGILKTHDSSLSESGFGGVEGANKSLLESVRRKSETAKTGVNFADDRQSVISGSDEEVTQRDVEICMPTTPELRNIEMNNRAMELLRGDAETSYCAEKILENVLSNIMSEAVGHKFNPVVKPRLIAEK